jgi:hypothetical protein
MMIRVLATLLLLGIPASASAAEKFCYHHGLLCDCATHVCEGDNGRSVRPVFTPTPQGMGVASCWGDDLVDVHGEPFCRVDVPLTGKALDDAVEAQRRKHANDPVMIDMSHGAPIAVPVDTCAPGYEAACEARDHGTDGLRRSEQRR